MQVKLPRAQEEFIQEKIACGVFSSPDALISEAVSLLQRQDFWAKEAATKIEQGWNEAQLGLLLSEDILIQNLTSRKAAWKSDRPKR